MIKPPYYSLQTPEQQCTFSGEGWHNFPTQHSHYLSIEMSFTTSWNCEYSFTLVVNRSSQVALPSWDSLWGQIVASSGVSFETKSIIFNSTTRNGNTHILNNPRDGKIKKSNKGFCWNDGQIKEAVERYLHIINWWIRLCIKRLRFAFSLTQRRRWTVQTVISLVPKFTVGYGIAQSLHIWSISAAYQRHKKRRREIKIVLHIIPKDSIKTYLIPNHKNHPAHPTYFSESAYTASGRPNPSFNSRMHAS